MASVTEDSITRLAKSVVDRFVNEDVALTQGVKEAAEKDGYNSDQVARLVERTNTEAFLRLFPGRTDFAVADPVAVNASTVKTASSNAGTGRLEKLASVSRKSYAETMNMSLHEIFDVTPEKLASLEPEAVTNDKYETWCARVKLAQIKEKIALEPVKRAYEISDAENELWEHFKTAALRGTPVSDIEVSLAQAYPKYAPQVEATVGYLTEKLASVTAMPVSYYGRANYAKIAPCSVVPESPINDAFGKVMSYVG